MTTQLLLDFTAPSREVAAAAMRYCAGCGSLLDGAGEPGVQGPVCPACAMLSGRCVACEGCRSVFPIERLVHVKRGIVRRGETPYAVMCNACTFECGAKVNATGSPSGYTCDGCGTPMPPEGRFGPGATGGARARGTCIE